MIRHLIASLFALTIASSCGKSEPTPPASTASAPAAAAPSASDEHAPAGYKPGTHEDWCGGHGVPESVCTRCNPKLIAAFKATGDWCAEHGLPESQCKACNPGLVITRPPKVAP